MRRISLLAHRAALAGAVGGVLLGAGCGSPAQTSSGGALLTATTSRVAAAIPSTPPQAPSTLPPEMAGVNRVDATAVASTAVRLWYTADTRVDLSPHSARLRACPLLTTRYCHAIRNFPPLTGPGADWLVLAADSTTIVVESGDVRVAAEVSPPDSATRALRLFEVVEHLSTPWSILRERRLVVAVSLTRDDSRSWWQVAQVKAR